MPTRAIPPRTLHVGPFTYTVAIGGELWREAVNSHADTNLAGSCDPVNLVIALNPDLAPGRMREVMLHETMHACCGTTDVMGRMHPDMDGGIEENALRVLTFPLLAVLRDNPDLVTYLTSP